MRTHVDEFITAPVDTVWAVIADPHRRTERDGPVTADIEPHADGAFTTTASTHRPDGRRVRLRPNRRRILHTPTRFEPPNAIAWSMTLPDWPPSDRVWRRSITLKPDGTGTRLRLEEELGRSRRLSRPRRALLRFFTRQGLGQRAAAIDRILR